MAPRARPALRRDHRSRPSCGHRAGPLRPTFEWLEERQMLDASEPLPIVVGRTLSSSTVAGVRDNQLTLTYTVYNERDTELAGVQLTTTLQAGVTFRDVSAPPSRNGQQLSWGLGTLPAFGRASVLVTVSLANPTQTQVDGGARATGTAGGQAVADAAPPAALRAGSVPADLIAPTPDADANDPYIQEKAAALDYDPQRIFAYLRDEVGYESYAGSLRGARGTLWSGAGNALDEASLGVALFRASGIPARYARGTLSPDVARELVATMFPDPLRAFGCLEPGTDLADPLRDPQLLAEAADHYWVQFDAGAGFVDADTSGLPGTGLGTPPTGAASTFAEVDDALRHKVRVELKAETLSQAAAAFGLAPGTQTVLDQMFNTVELVGRPLSVGHFVNVSGVTTPIFSNATITYSPYIVVGQDDGSPGTAPLFRGTDYQEVLTNFPLSSVALTGLFLDVSTIAPEQGGRRAVETIEKALVDRFGYAARQGLQAASVQVGGQARASLSDFDITTLVIDPSAVSEAALAAEERGLAGTTQVIDATVPAPGGEVADPAGASRAVSRGREALMGLTSAIGHRFRLASDLASAALAGTILTRAYPDSPRIVAVSSRAEGDPNAPETDRVTLEVDILRNATRAYAFPGQAADAATTFRATKGLADSSIEQQVLPPPAEETVAAGALTIIANALATPGATLVPVTAETLTNLAALPLPADAVARITRAVRDGHIVFVPSATATIAGRARAAWLEAVPETGETISVSDHGTHNAEEYPTVQVGATKAGGTVLTADSSGFSFAARAAERANALLRSSKFKEAKALLREVQDLLSNLSGRLFIEFWETLTFAEAKIPIGREGDEIIYRTVSFLNFFLKNDPPVGDALLVAPPSPEFAGLGDGGAGGVALGIAPDDRFTVPVAGAQVPTVFKAGFKNLEASRDRFALSVSGLPAGFEAETSLTQMTAGPGETAEFGICVHPGGVLPAPGTPISFNVTAASTTDPSVSVTKGFTFTMPEVGGVALSSSPLTLGALPGRPATATITVTDSGNVAETIDLAAALPAGLSAVGLPRTIALQPNQSTTFDVMVTPSPSTPLDSLLVISITATFDAAGQPGSETESLLVRVVVPGVDALAAASAAAGQLGQAGLAGRLNDLAVSLTSLVQDPANAVFKGQGLTSLGAVSGLLAADAFLAPTVPALAAGRADLARATTAADVQDAVVRIGRALGPVAGTLADEAAHKLTLALLTNSQVIQPQTPATFGIAIQNTGTQATTYDLSVEGLPAGVTATFSQALITLGPGQGTPGTPGLPPLTVTVTPTSAAEVAPFTFRVVAAAREAAEIRATATGSLAARTELVQVASVAIDVPFTEPGGRVAVSARILNSVNRQQPALVSYTVTNAGGNVLFTSTPVATTLSVLSTLTTVDLGPLDTTGFAPGQVTINVVVTDPSGNPIPGATGRGTLLIGTPVAGTLASAPAALPPGDGVVTNTLAVDTRIRLVGGFDVVGQAPVGGAGGVARSGDFLYVACFPGIAVYNISDPSSPQLLGVVPQFNDPGPQQRILRVQGDELVEILGGGSTVVSVFSLADPANPQLLGNSPLLPYNFLQDAIVVGSHVYIATAGLAFVVTTHDIVAHWGTLLSVDISDPAHPRLDGVLDDTNGTNNDGVGIVNGVDTSGGNSNVWSVARADANTLLVGTTTVTGTDTQAGVGRVCVVDISDPAHMAVVRDVDIPGTVEAVGVASDGNRALVVASTGGFGDFAPDFAFTGNIALATLDLSSPRDPALVATQPMTRSSAGLHQDAALGGGLFVFASQGTLGVEPPQMFVVDASDLRHVVATSTNVPSDVFRLSGDGTLVETTSPNGLILYRIGAPQGIAVTARAFVPKGTGVAVVPGSFNIAPTRIIAGPDSDALEWDLNLAAGATGQTLTWQSTVAGLRPGESRPVTLGATVGFVNQGTPGSLTLPPTTVAADHIIGLSPASREARPAEPTSFVVTLKNPTASAVTYALAVQGVPAGWVLLAPTATVGPNSSVNVPMTLASEAFAAPAGYDFTVTATAPTGAADSVTGTLTLAGQPATQPDTEAHGVLARLTPAVSFAGQGTTARFVVRLTNVGSATETFSLKVAGLPSGVDAAFDRDAMEVPPGASNFRDVTLTLTPRPGTAPGAYTLRVTAASETKPSVVGATDGTLGVLRQGVSVTLNPPSGAPGGGFQVTVTNTGLVADTFDLSLAGPAALVARLGTGRVALAPGASRVVPIATTTADFAVPGALGLTAMATSRANPILRDAASADLRIAPARGLVAHLDPAVRALPVPGSASFLLLVDNTGNVEDAYTAEIVGTSGPVAATLVGLDGLPARAIPLFRLPGLATGAILIHADLASLGQGTVTVRVRSLGEAAKTATATATVSAGATSIATTTQLLVTPNPATAGQPVTFVAVVSARPGAVPVGTVTFTLDGTALPSVPLRLIGSQARAVLTIAAPGAGPHTITAFYGGNRAFLPSASRAVALAVNSVVTPAADGPRLVGPVKRFGFHARPTTLVLSFDGPLDPARARDAANYRIVGPGGQRIPVAAAVYDPATNTVTLHPSRRLDVHRRYWLTVNSGPSGLAGPLGIRLDGDGDGRPGGDYVAVVDRRNLVLPPPIRFRRPAAP